MARGIGASVKCCLGSSTDAITVGPDAVACDTRYLMEWLEAGKKGDRVMCRQAYGAFRQMCQEFCSPVDYFSLWHGI